MRAFMRRLAGAAVLFAFLAGLMTAPIAVKLSTALPNHDDAYFSVWRLAWVAHEFPRDPAKLFDANIFYPARGALAYSDATLLPALVGSPAIWLGVHPVSVHNALLLSAFALSGLAMFLLAFELTRQSGPAILAGIIFAFAPYKFGHIGHLELQWTCWMPLGLCAIHRLWTTGLIRYGVLLGVFVVLLGYSSLYYLVFFGAFLCAFLVALAERTSAPMWKRRLTGLAAAALVGAVALIPYLAIYSASRSSHPPRTATEVEKYSASVKSYLRVSPDNRLYTFLRRPINSDELSLFPGAVALALAAFAVAGPVSRTLVTYGASMVFAFVMSLGSRAGLFTALQAVVPPLANLRAPARFGVLVLLCLAVLSAFGAAKLLRGRSRPITIVTTAVLGALCLVEYWSVPLRVLRPITRPPLVHQWLARQTPGSATIMLPIPRPWKFETLHEYLSIYHWQPMVNGYSGFLPDEYYATLEVLRGFPNPQAIQHLRGLGVSSLVIWQDKYALGAYEKIAATLKMNPDVEAALPFPDPVFRAVVFPLRRMP